MKWYCGVAPFRRRLGDPMSIYGAEHIRPNNAREIRNAYRELRREGLPAPQARRLLSLTFAAGWSARLVCEDLAHEARKAQPVSADEDRRALLGDYAEPGALESAIGEMLARKNATEEGAPLDPSVAAAAPLVGAISTGDIGGGTDGEGAPAWPCGASHPTRFYLCTLDRGHDGDHVAHDAEDVVCATWPQEGVLACLACHEDPDVVGGDYVQCSRERGHDGNHRADLGDDQHAAWSDTASGATPDDLTQHVPFEGAVV